MTKKELQKRLELLFKGWVRIEEEKTNVFDNEWQRQIEQTIIDFDTTFKLSNITGFSIFISHASIQNGMLSYRCEFDIKTYNITTLKFTTYHCSTDYVL